MQWGIINIEGEREQSLKENNTSISWIENMCNVKLRNRKYV